CALGRHCVTAFCGLRPMVMQGEVSPCEPLLPAFQLNLVYQTQLSIRGQGASMPLATRLESSKRCYWLCQTSGWPDWAGKDRSKPNRFLRPAAGVICSFVGFDSACI